MAKEKETKFVDLNLDSYEHGDDDDPADDFRTQDGAIRPNKAGRGGMIAFGKDLKTLRRQIMKCGTKPKVKKLIENLYAICFNDQETGRTRIKATELLLSYWAGPPNDIRDFDGQQPNQHFQFVFGQDSKPTIQVVQSDGGSKCVSSSQVQDAVERSIQSNSSNGSGSKQDTNRKITPNLRLSSDTPTSSE